MGELVDFFAQRRDVFARLAQCVGELLVLAHRLGELALGVEQTFLEGPDTLGRILQTTAEGHDLFLHRLQLILQFRHAHFVGAEATFVFSFVHR